MKNLILDCSAGMSIFVQNEDKTFSYIDENQKKHTDELLVQVDKLLNEANLKIQDLENLCVCVGPGSFTGIRVAVSIVKGLAVSKNFKIFTLSNFDIYDTGKAKNKVLVLEGFSKFVYVRKIIQGKTYDLCENIDDLISFLKENKNDFEIFVQNEKLQKTLILAEIQCKIASKCTIFAFDELIIKNKNIALEQINPIYLRASQAEIERQKKLENDGK